MRRTRTIVAGLSVSALAAGSAVAASGAAELPAGAPGSGAHVAGGPAGPSGGNSLGSDVVRENLTNSYREWAKKQPPLKKRSRPSAAVLKRSATEHRGRKTATEAREQIGELAPGFTTSHSLIPDADDVKQPLAANALQLERKDGKPGGAMVSNMPLAVPPSNKDDIKDITRWRLADLDFKSDGSRYRVARTYLPVSVPKSAGGQTTVDDLGLSFAPKDSTSTGSVDGESITYPNVDTDTDLTLRSSSIGVKAGWTLRSPQAPSAIKVPLDLPEGTTAKVADDQGTVTISNGAGETIGALSSPVALDSAGFGVGVKTTIQDGTITYDVQDEEGTTAYPVVVDPVFSKNWEAGSMQSDFNYWYFNKSRPQVPFGGQTLFDPGYAQYRGLQVYGQAGPAITGSSANGYGSGDWATFARYAPGNQSMSLGSQYVSRRIAPDHAYWYRADLTGIDYAAQNNAFPDPNPTFAFLPYQGNFPGITQKFKLTSAGTTYGPYDGGATNFSNNVAAASVQLWLPGANTNAPNDPDGAVNARSVVANRPDNIFVAGLFDRNVYGGNARPNTAVYLGGYTLFASDDVAPSVATTTSTGPAAWVASASSIPTSVGVTATDNGTGVLTTQLKNTSGTVLSQSPTNYCPVNQDTLCSYTQNSTLSIPTPGEGRTDYTIDATDGSGTSAANGLTTPANARKTLSYAVDTKAPIATPSGDLYAKRDFALADGASRNLTVQATDGAYGGSGSLLSSGVQQIQVKLDGTVVKTETQTNSADSAALSTTWTANADTISQGDHVVQYVATDRVGRTSPLASFTLRRQSLGPGKIAVGTSGGAAGFGPNWDSDAVSINAFNGNLVAHEVDQSTDPSATPIDNSIFGVDRYYNSSNGDSRNIGPGWTLGTGPEVRLTFPSATEVRFATPSQAVIAFRANGSDYTPSVPGWALLKVGSSWQVTYADSGRRFTFSDTGRLTGSDDTADGTGATVASTGSGSTERTSSITGSNGNRFDLTYDTSNTLLQGFTTPGGPQGSYTYMGTRLSKAVHANGDQSTYGYDASGRLSDISRTGYAMHAVYDTAGRATSLAETTDDETVTVTLTYRAPDTSLCGSPSVTQTDATFSDGQTASYCFDGNGNQTGGRFSPEPRFHDDQDDPNLGENGYGTDDPAGYCPTGADPQADCNEDALDNPVTSDGLADSGIDVVDDDGTPALAPASTNTAGATAASGSKVNAPFSSLLAKGGTGWGLADQNPDIFTSGKYDTELADLKIRRMRYAIPWSAVLRSKGDVKVQTLTPKGVPTRNGSSTLSKNSRELDNAARVIDNAPANVDVLLTIDKTAGDDVKGGNLLPTTKQYRDGVIAIHRRFPRAKYIGSFNEMNNAYYPLRAAPGRAGEFWSILNKYCKSATDKCTAIAGDFVDAIGGSQAKGTKTLGDYLPAFKKAAGYSSSAPPPFWGLHGYESAQASKRDELPRVTAFANATACMATGAKKCKYQPQIFLTEQGGIFSRYPTSAEGDGKFMASLERRGSTRIKRFYYYQMSGDSFFDSGLKDYTTNTRRTSLFDYIKNLYVK